RKEYEINLKVKEKIKKNYSKFELLQLKKVDFSKLFSNMSLDLIDDSNSETHIYKSTLSNSEINLALDILDLEYVYRPFL
ncbi:14149_t:CDS:1, partial [Racocetra persica]